VGRLHPHVRHDGGDQQPEQALQVFRVGLAPCVGNLPNCPGVRDYRPRDERANTVGDRPDGTGRLQDDGVALAQVGGGPRVAAHHRHLVRSQDLFLGSVHYPDHDVLLVKVEGDVAVNSS